MRTGLLHPSAWVCALLLTGLSSCVPANPGIAAGAKAPGCQDLRDRMRRSAQPSVLFIGNSYSFGVPKAFEKLSGQHGFPVSVSQVAHDGWTLARHSTDENTLHEIRSRRWDVIVLQEMSLTPSVPLQRNLRMLPAVRELAAEARRQGAVPVLYQTWGYRNGDPHRAGDDFLAMNRRVREGYVAAAKHSGDLPVIPVGDAWEREFSTGHGASLYKPDGSHPTPRGNQLAAETFLSALLGTN